MGQTILSEGKNPLNVELHYLGGENMSKTHEELATEMTIAIINARGVALAGIGQESAGQAANRLNVLNDGAAASIYQHTLAVLKANK